MIEQAFSNLALKGCFRVTKGQNDKQNEYKKKKG